MADPDWTTHHDRLRWARSQRFATIKEAADAIGEAAATLQAHETGTRARRGFPPELARKYARRFGVSETWLVTGIGEPVETVPTGMRRVRVSGWLQAGVWTESFEMPETDQFDVFVADREKLRGWPLYAGLIRGESMNKIYPPGTIVVLTHRLDGEADIVPGRRYHIERTREDGSCENTIKTVRRRADGSLWLVPESDDPEFQAAIPAKRAAGEQLRYVGRVVSAIIDEE